MQSALPLPWQGHRSWRILLIDPAWPLRFLQVWQAWRAATERPEHLHVLCLSSAAPRLPADLADLGTSERIGPGGELARQCVGLLPGVHRLVFESGAVQLTLAIGPVDALLREQELEADSIALGEQALALEPSSGARSLARCCRPGTLLSAPDAGEPWRAALVSAGFCLQSPPEGLAAVFAPRWPARRRWSRPAQTVPPGRCTVIGAGLAGAACAASLARRGWQVTVLDRQGPAAGASGLPVGLMAPHVSPDDGPLSRLSRAGLRATLQQARELLAEGRDWSPCGVLQRRLDGEGAQLPAAWPEAGWHWSRDASAAESLPAGLRSQALWHPSGAWIRPARLIAAWLAESGVGLVCGMEAAQLQRLDTGQWQVRDAQGEVLDQSDLVVLAGGHRTQTLIAPWLPAGSVPMQAVRGQVSWALHAAGEVLPPVPVNGHGSLVPDYPAEGARAWLLGATFDRDQDDEAPRPADHAATLAKLRHLLPETAASLAPRFERAQVKAWAGVRCSWRDHLPVVGPLSLEAQGLWLCTGFGSRGLSYSALCAELLAAWLHGEPLPLEPRLAQQLQASRLLKPR